VVSINISVEESLSKRLDRFSWVNWSDVARIEANKRRIFEEYKKSRKIGKEDERFCESIDWHPVDELPLKPEFIESLKRIDKEKSIPMTLEKLDKMLHLR
jgi:hypothetical protein